MLSEVRAAPYRSSQVISLSRGLLSLFVGFIALVAAVAIPGCNRAGASELRANPNGCGEPVSRIDNWPIATPESVGLSKDALCPLVEHFTKTPDDDLHAVLVARHGKLVFEQYFSGRDEENGMVVGTTDFAPVVKHDERSVSKSVVSLMIGIAIDHGWIHSVDDPVMGFFPDYADLATPEKKKITIRDLLTMSSGIEWHESDVPYTSARNSEIIMNDADDPYRYALTPPMVTAPGKVFNYNSGSPELLGEILRRKTATTVDELARKMLFAPIGVTDVEWGKFDNGRPVSAAGLRLRPRDLLKVGQLILQHGNWNGKQVVSTKWIDDATSPQITGEIGKNRFDYGYLFWIGRSVVNHRVVVWAAAEGLGGQRCFVIPALDMVVVTNAGLYESDRQGSVPFEILNEYVIAAIED